MNHTILLDLVIQPALRHASSEQGSNRNSRDGNGCGSFSPGAPSSVLDDLGRVDRKRTGRAEEASVGVIFDSSAFPRRFLLPINTQSISPGVSPWIPTSNLCRTRREIFHHPFARPGVPFISVFHRAAGLAGIGNLRRSKSARNFLDPPERASVEESQRRSWFSYSAPRHSSRFGFSARGQENRGKRR